MKIYLYPSAYRLYSAFFCKPEWCAQRLFAQHSHRASTGDAIARDAKVCKIMQDYCNTLATG